MAPEYCSNCGAELDSAGNCPVRYAQNQYSEERFLHDMILEESA